MYICIVQQPVVAPLIYTICEITEYDRGKNATTLASSFILFYDVMSEWALIVSHTQLGSHSMALRFFLFIFQI